jgi:hypothetical protein
VVHTRAEAHVDGDRQRANPRRCDFGPRLAEPKGMTGLAYWFAPLTLVACAGSGTATVTTTDAEYDSTAQAIASSSRPSGGGGELDAMIDVTVLARGGLVPGFSFDADGRFHGRHGSFDISVAVACRNADGDSQLLCDAFTDEADVDVSWSGSLHLPNLDITLSREGHWKASALTTSVARLDGDGQTDYDGRLNANGVVTTDALDSDADFDAVLIPRDGRAPTSGTIRYSLDVERTRTGNGLDEERHLEIDAVLTFAADGHATLVLDGRRRYDLDLATGVVVTL